MSKKSRKRVREGSQDAVDTELRTKRKRQVTNDKLQLYKLYEDLAAESDEVRLGAAKQLILKFSPENHPAANDVRDVLNRLVRGLCTQRKAARFGFCVTLTELLRQLFGISQGSIESLNLDVDSLLNSIDKNTKIEGNVSGMERRDHLIGKLFAYKAILQSSILIEPESLDGWTELLDRIYGMARDVPWLREECGLILVEAIENLNSRDQLESYAQALIQRLVSSKLVNTPEGVAVWLIMRTKYEKVLPNNIWHKNDPLAKKERLRLAKILKGDIHNSVSDGKQDDIKSAGASPNPSFVWDLLLSKMLEVDSNRYEDKADADKSEFAQFWLDTVDAHLFGSSSSHERKSWGFKLFSKVIGQVPEWIIPKLFSPNFVRTLLNQTKKDDRFLHATALNAWKAITHRAEQSPSSAVSLVIALTSNNGAGGLENFTKTKTLEQILLVADDGSLRKIVRHLYSLIIRPETSEQAMADHRRQNIAGLLLNLVRHYKHYESLLSDTFDKNNWLRNTLDLMVEFAYFSPSKKAKTSKVPLPLISDSNRKMFQERLSSCLTRLLNVEGGSHTSFGLTVIGMIRAKITVSKELESTFKAEDSVIDTVEKAFKALDGLSLEISAAGPTSAIRGLVLLYTFTLLQVYNGDGDAVLMLEDLESSSKGLLRTVDEPTTQAQDGFVEILLSFLGNPRALFHKIAIEAFKTFASELSSEGLRGLTDVLDTEESLEGQRRLFAQEDEEAESEGTGDDSGSDSEEDSEDASDVEMIDGEDASADGSDVDSSDEESSSGTGSDTEDSGEDEELIQFNNMLAMTLQTSKPILGDEGDEDSSESDMDDDQMMALDPHLSSIFKQRSQITGKKQRKDAKQNMIQFKSRVLDLLAVFLDKQYSNPVTLEALLPVLRLARATANKQLSDKSAKLLKSTFETHSKHKTLPPKPVDAEATWQILQGIHEEAKMGGGASIHTSSCSIASLHLVRVLIGLDRDNYTRVVDLYADSQKQWFGDKQSSVQPVLFSQFLNWSSQARSSKSQKQGKK